MEHKVTLQNTQQTLMLQEHETILEAAIRAGISMNYGCSSGTCGLCKAQLIEGSVKEIKPREYAFSEAEKLQGFVLSCVCGAVSDIVINASVANEVSSIPVQEISVKVRKLETMNEQVYRLFVQTPRTSRLRFLAGQYVEIGINDVGSRRFAIASCPCEDRHIELHLRISENDPLSQTVANNMKPGSSLILRGPFGEFVYDENSSRPLILFAFDTGFAAIKSLLEHITAQEQELKIHLIWMACGVQGLYMNNLCRAWMDALDGFNYTGIALNESLQQLVRHPQQACATVEAHLWQAMQEYEDLSCHDIYVSAPAPAERLFESVCKKKKASMKRFFTEPVRENEDMSCIGSIE